MNENFHPGQLVKLSTLSSSHKQVSCWELISERPLDYRRYVFKHGTVGMIINTYHAPQNPDHLYYLVLIADKIYVISHLTLRALK